MFTKENKKMNKQTQNRYKNLCSLTTNFREHQLKKGINYDQRSNEAEHKLTTWIKEICPSVDKFELEELIGEIRVEQEHSIITLLANLEAINIDNDKLPKMKVIVSINQVNILED